MAALPKFRRILREDIPGAPDWVDRMLYVLNGFMDSVYLALNQNLTLGDNVTAYKTTFSVKAGAAPVNNTYSFTLPKGFPKPTLLIIGAVTQAGTVYTPVQAAVFCSWRFNGTQVIIDAISGLTNGQTYSITVLIF